MVSANELKEAMTLVAKATMADPIHKPVFLRLKELHDIALAEEAHDTDMDSLIASMAA